jgi:hypothetical protein
MSCKNGQIETVGDYYVKVNLQLWKLNKAEVTGDGDQETEQEVMQSKHNSSPIPFKSCANLCWKDYNYCVLGLCGSTAT